jgi:hypothetical protein
VLEGKRKECQMKKMNEEKHGGIFSGAKGVFLKSPTS